MKSAVAVEKFKFLEIDDYFNYLSKNTGVYFSTIALSIL